MFTNSSTCQGTTVKEASTQRKFDSPPSPLLMSLRAERSNLIASLCTYKHEGVASLSLHMEGLLATTSISLQDWGNQRSFKRGAGFLLPEVWGCPLIPPFLPQNWGTQGLVGAHCMRPLASLTSSPQDILE
jgi:hypothetical protein